VAAGFTVTIVGSSVACGAHLETRMPQFANQFLSFKRKVERRTRPFELFNPHEIHQGFVRQGFEVRAERPQFLLPTVLYRMGGSRRLARTAERPGRWLGLTRSFGSPVVVRADRCRNA
jgi:hypothetical protein